LLTVLPSDIEGIAYGLLRTVWFGLGSTAPFVVGLLTDNGKFEIAFFLFAVIAATAVVIFVRLPRRTTGASA
jgi:membrane protein implicated in regulation of membrane protease activity